ncbi:hypothetical protein [Amycolatopsis sp. MtRt-6]|uniref:hypothetical protein n=1 Tax=Amycolatopsis sp. MtRt-6 TaxID=2792782 RepID=UPI001A8E6E05|nr:hypothetical protein [Amycolatopsis sp. MtRt-6]
MRLNSVFNFVQLLDELANHDLEADPYTILTGPQSSGKSTIHAETLRSLKYRGLTLEIDARETAIEDQLVSRALSCATKDELIPSRILLQSTRTQIVIANSSLNHSNLKVRNQRWRRGRSDSTRKEEVDAGARVSLLISDIIAVSREVFVVVDHRGDAEPFYEASSATSPSDWVR